MRRIAFLHVLVVGLLIGSSGPASAKAHDPTKAGAAWLRALFATGSANDAQAALPLVAPNSPAYTYTVHQIGGLKAEAGTGVGTTPSSVKKKGHNVVLCSKALSGNGCVTLGRFELDELGRIKTFSFIDGKARKLVPPVLGTGQSGGAFGVTFKLASYYRTRDALVVILDVTGASDGARKTVEASEATYQPVRGSAIQASTARGLAGNIEPGVAATVELQFPGTAKPGGTITIPMGSGPPDYSNGSATIPLQ